MQEGRREQLTAVRERLDGWRRRHGGRGRRIPEALWDEAARVAKLAGLAETARALRLREGALGVRMGKAGGAGAGEGRGPRPTFVELTGLGHLGGAGQRVVELVRGDGALMRIHLAGASAAEVVSLAEAFWSPRS